MPKNLKEELVFTGLMAGMMVLGITIYNVLKSNGINIESWKNIETGYPSGLVVAILFDLVIVGPIAKKIFLDI